MQICLNCEYENPEGEMFCRRCGVALGVLSVSTTQLGSENELTPGGAFLSLDHVVFLHVAGHADPVALQISTQTVLGRESGEERLNLEKYEAVTLGVSRQHAMLFVQDDHRLFIRDLGSTNRTYLNGQQLEAGHDYPVRDGDEVMSGRLVFKIFFK